MDPVLETELDFGRRSRSLPTANDALAPVPSLPAAPAIFRTRLAADLLDRFGD
jgi:hypothetical protein